MKEEGGREAVRSKCSNSTSQLCFITSPSAVSQSSALLSCDMELLRATPEPGSLSGVTLGHKHCRLLSLPRTGLSDGSLVESAPLPLQQQQDNEHQQTPSPPHWIPVLLQDIYIYISHSVALGLLARGLLCAVPFGPCSRGPGSAAGLSWWPWCPRGAAVFVHPWFCHQQSE